ncbi:hypothetical protein D6D17_04660 [Aureobasidium pullulans]|uniref:Uncharacterized protein n=1 Tax=Aureobasidium pullulans TaxID=5580 RepID=A0A4S9P7Z5_AURPU|nr:hypothetical protein D6D17_04660 [Aureobasidium pullulans]THY65777.1 hypothetical protein D6C97_02322 [Aureobasidium pullulans]TIA56167.1 hypothetical protein D6C77_07078 [Aureobasidium pullulans]TIA75696.1 hypothetical protein D6C83_00248 [Aureobasidium pullulans]TIA80307.1 hypothetical protein D6C76_03235 [Aureobasidium pullulans]
MSETKSAEFYVRPPFRWQEAPQRTSCPSKFQQPTPQRACPAPPSEDPDPEDQFHSHLMVDRTLALLEGTDDSIGVYCVCHAACRCREHCVAAPRDTKCPCNCFYKEVQRLEIRRRALASSAVEEAQEVDVQEDSQSLEERPITPRSQSVYSQNSIQASLQNLQVYTPSNLHSSLPTEGTFSMSRAELWTRLSQPGPPTPKTPMTPTKTRSSKG